MLGAAEISIKTGRRSQCVCFYTLSVGIPIELQCKSWSSMNQKCHLHELDIVRLLRLINGEASTEQQSEPYLIKNGVKIIF